MHKDSPITQKVLRTIRTAMPETEDGRVLVALSGGADSMCLLTALLRLGYKVEAAHCNFHLRGTHSDNDALFVQRHCQQQNVPLHLTDFDTKHEAELYGESIEMAARRLRYAWFEEVIQTTGIQILCVAHHLNDNVETTLLNLTRGTGIRGLTGMARHHKHIVRPMLTLTRQEIEDFLKEESIDFVTDHTNTDTRFRRNKIRHEVLPLLRSINPSVDQAIADTMQHLSGTACLVEYAVNHLRNILCKDVDKGIDIDKTTLLSLPFPTEGRQALLHELLAPYQFSPVLSDIFAGFSKEPGSIFENRDYIATHTAKGLSIRMKPKHCPPLALPFNDTVLLPNGTLLQTQCLARTELPEIPRSADTACLDADKVKETLHCRSIQEGDRFRPFGMRGTKLVSDYLTDRKRSRIEKMAACVVCDGSQIVWLIGERPDDRYAITSNTRNILLIKAKKAESTE